jgi:polyisoprenoid-binding protein YceI
LRQGNIALSENGKTGGAIVVDATTGASGNHGRDSKMHKEIIESAKYPDITFTPTEITGAVPSQGDADVDLRGALKMHGQDHEIVIHATVHIDGNELTSEVNFPVKYVDWGVKNPSTLFLRVSDTVQIRVLVRGHFVSRP